jgi:hypothetical protein
MRFYGVWKNEKEYKLDSRNENQPKGRSTGGRLYASIQDMRQMDMYLQTVEIRDILPDRIPFFPPERAKRDRLI